MAQFYEQLDDKLSEWIRQQHIFFVATAPLSADGRVNLSPKGRDCLRILDETTLAYLDMTGSGNETSAHIMENGRITFMWCAVEGPPRIMRTFGRGEVVLPGTPRWEALAPQFEMLSGARQIIVNHVETVQTSCGYAVPIFEYVEDRDVLEKWADHKGEDGIKTYHLEKNMKSIDGLPTPLSTVMES